MLVAVHKRRRQLGGGKGSKIGQNCRRIVLKNCRKERGGCQKSGKIVDVVYGWSPSNMTQAIFLIPLNLDSEQFEDVLKCKY